MAACKGTDLSRISDPVTMTQVGQSVTVPCPECGVPLTGPVIRHPQDPNTLCLQITAHQRPAPGRPIPDPVFQP